MKIVLASANGHKVRELRSIFEGHHVITPPDLGLAFEHEETGTTFFANAYGKAQALYALLAARHGRDGVPDPAADDIAVVADDSGICVDALSGGPGVYSARFGAAEGAVTDEDRTRLLLQKLSGVEQRGAHYVCCMVAILGVDRFVCAQATWHGRIALERSNGTTGFGYDPVFLLPGKGMTVADITEDEKHDLSHRGKAARAIHVLLSRPAAT